MEELKLDKNKITTFKGKEPKKALFLEIEKKPEARNSRNINDFVCLNDNLYVFDYYSFNGDLKWGGGIMLFSVILHFFSGGTLTSGPFLITGLIFLFGLSYLIKLLVIKNKKVIMDRMEGLFSYPNYWSNTPAIVNFKDAILLFTHKGKMSVPALVAPYTNVKFGGFTLAIVDVMSQFSFYVWYMDKNRPLPPGTAFDAYREKDFERRKAE